MSCIKHVGIDCVNTMGIYTPVQIMFSLDDGYKLAYAVNNIQETPVHCMVRPDW